MSVKPQLWAVRGQAAGDHSASPNANEGSADHASVTLSDEAAVVRCFTKKTTCPLPRAVGPITRSSQRPWGCCPARIWSWGESPPRWSPDTIQRWLRTRPTAAGSWEGGRSMTTPLDMVVGKLQAAGCDPSPTGTNAYESRCPVHHGKRKNLSVGVGEDGRVLLNCHHAGENGSPSCPVDAIVGVLGLRLEDLYPKSNGPTTTKPKTSGKKSWRTLDEAVGAVGYHLKPTSTETWTYHDTHGDPVMAVGRFDAGEGRRPIARSIRCRTGRGRWVIRPGCCRCTGCPR